MLEGICIVIGFVYRVRSEKTLSAVTFNSTYNSLALISMYINLQYIYEMLHDWGKAGNKS